MYAPMKDPIWPTVSGSEQVARVLTRCGVAVRVPAFQIYPSILVDIELISVSDVESQISNL